MNIAVVIASRGRPVWLTGALTSLWRLRCGEHDIGFLVGVDEDDQATADACTAMAKVMPLAWRAMPRPTCLGAIHNALLPETPEADIVSTWIDRLESLTLGWDHILVQSNLAQPHRVLWWSSPQDPGFTIPIFPRTWLTAAKYTWAPEIFPFWFDDTWVMQVDRLVFGGPGMKVQALYGTERGRTTRLRDLKFWGEVFHALLPARITEAQEMAKALNVPWQDRPELIEEFTREAQWFADNANRLEGIFSDGREPTPEYLATKAAAKRFLKQEAEA